MHRQSPRRLPGPRVARSWPSWSSYEDWPDLRGYHHQNDVIGRERERERHRARERHSQREREREKETEIEREIQSPRERKELYNSVNVSIVVSC